VNIFRKIIIIIGIIGLLWFSIPLVSGILNLGNATGITFNTILLVYGLFMDKINIIIGKIWQNRGGKICLSILCTFIAMGMLVILIISGCMYKTSRNRPQGEVTLVVLGCHVRNGRPSLMLGERLAAALEYLNEHEDTICILSGGQGADEAISEAQCMYDNLTANGISSDRLIMEDRSTSTIENLKYSNEIIEEKQLNPKVAIVTNEFHEYRAYLIAKKLGLETYAIPASTHWWFYPTYLVREWYGAVYEWCR